MTPAWYAAAFVIAFIVLAINFAAWRLLPKEPRRDDDDRDLPDTIELGED